MAYVIGAILFGILGIILTFEPEWAGEVYEKVSLVLYLGIAGGYLFGAMLSSVLIFSWYINQKSKKVKTLAIILSLIGLPFLFQLGGIGTLPYYVWSVIKLRKRRYISER